MTKPVSQNTSLPSISHSNGKSRCNMENLETVQFPKTHNSKHTNKETTPVFFFFFPQTFFVFHFTFIFNGAIHQHNSRFIEASRYKYLTQTPPRPLLLAIKKKKGLKHFQQILQDMFGICNRSPPKTGSVVRKPQYLSQIKQNPPPHPKPLTLSHQTSPFKLNMKKTKQNNSLQRLIT